MATFRFFHPIEIRYGDIDAQRHVNNARYFTYMEQARAHYLLALGLWNAEDYDRIGIILAEQSCTYRAPITLKQRVEVGVRTERMGEKSIEMRYSFRDQDSQAVLAEGLSILVAYDYLQGISIAIPMAWRNAIGRFEADPAGDAGRASDGEAVET